ncbi:hypothetical protein F5Y01DRAFT_14300 [Xylaria sp. FL0043]|nr:hypothetical protein F5Y01DRAFT_14300 [Xylaria sp. FL0043]
MLQRPRNILINHDSCRPSQSKYNWTDYRNTLISNIQLTTLGRFNCNLWDKTTAQLAAKWEKTITKRQIHSLKRSMVKQLAAGQNVVSYPVGSITKTPSTAAARDSVDGGSEPCLRKFDVFKGNLSQEYVGRDQGSSSDRGLSRNTDSMEGNNEAISTQRSRNGRPDREGERRLTAEEYIARRKEIAVEKVVTGFQRWLDKRLAIISYTIQASEAADGTGTGARDSNSQSQEMGEKKSGGANRRQKRQFSDGGNAGDFPGGDDNGQDRGGNKRAKKDTEPEEIKLACPFHKHNPKAHKKELCMKGGWKSIHRLKEHLYRVHLLPKHNCPRCNARFGDDEALRAHLRADEPCKRSHVTPEEGIDQDTERKLRERKRPNSGETETQRWKDIYLLLFPQADPNAIPSPYPDHDETAAHSKNFERYKRVEKRIKRELPRLVKQRVEKKFEKVETEMLHGINDIIRNCLADFFRNNNMSQDDGSSTTTPQTASRATTPGLTSLEEPCAPSFDQSFEPQIDINYLLDDPDWALGGDLGLFDFNPQFNVDGGLDGYGGDKVPSDSGYMSTTP